jgi:hypothetical protein
MARFTVNFAVYGALPGGNSENAQAFNVTSELSSVLNAPGATGVVLCGNNLKGDPSPGNLKHFGAIVNGRYFACQEGQTIDFNHAGGTPRTSGLVVRFAVYGALPGGNESDAQAFDVTALVQAAVNESGGTVACDNASFGDPSVGNQKHFAAVVNRGGHDLYFACVENQTIDFRNGGGSL